MNKFEELYKQVVNASVRSGFRPRYMLREFIKRQKLNASTKIAGMKNGDLGMQAVETTGTVAEIRCPICSGTSFIDYRKRVNARCAKCGALERTRVLWLAFEQLNLGQTSGQVFHFAPEKCLSDQIVKFPKIDYQPRDFDPTHFANYPKEVKKFDLCSDAANLPANSVAGVMHSHVFEHLPCNIYKVFLDLNRAIRPGGFHLFIVPFFKRYYSEDLSPETTDEERTIKYGQFDHVRAFGTEDFDKLFSSAFDGFERIDLDRLISPQDLTQAAVKPSSLRVKGGNFVMCFRKL